MHIWQGMLQISTDQYQNLVHTSNVLYQHTEAEKNGHPIADNIFKCIFSNQISFILIKIPLKFVHKDPINNNATLTQTMGWHWTSNSPVSQQFFP